MGASGTGVGTVGSTAGGVGRILVGGRPPVEPTPSSGGATASLVGGAPVGAVVGGITTGGGAPVEPTLVTSTGRVGDSSFESVVVPTVGRRLGVIVGDSLGDGVSRRLSMNDWRSSEDCRVSIWEVLSSEDVDDVVDAGAVAFVTICRFIWRGK